MQKFGTRRELLFGAAAIAAGSVAVKTALAANSIPPGPPLPPRGWSKSNPTVPYPDPNVQVLDPRFKKYIAGTTLLRREWTGADWTEGPTWFGDMQCVIFSDIPNDRLMRYDAMTGKTEVFRRPSHFTNGTTRYDRSDAKVENVYDLIKASNFVKSIDPKTGELTGRRDMTEGKQKDLCPAINGGVSWNSGTYSPQTGLYYKIGNEWCMDLDIVKSKPVVEPAAQLNIGATFTIKAPPGEDKAYGHLDPRDPITGKLSWSVNFPEPPLASLLSTAGGVVFVPDTRGSLHALDAKTGKELWKADDGAPHNGGIISYDVGGKQYVAVVTGGPSLVMDGYADLFGGPYKTMEKDTGSLLVYALQ